jgi:hypothetical protein
VARILQIRIPSLNGVHIQENATVSDSASVSLGGVRVSILRIEIVHEQGAPIRIGGGVPLPERKYSLVINDVDRDGLTDLAKVRLAYNQIGLLPGFVQSRKQNANQGGDDAYNNEQLDERESMFRFEVYCSAELGFGW